MSLIVSILADLLVAVLLVACIGTSVSLGRRITRLKGDESAMRQTIGDLMVATESAERAITGLRTTLAECDRTLGERLRLAERTNADLAAQLQAGDEVLSRIARIVSQARAAVPGEAAGQAAFAQTPFTQAAFASRPRRRRPPRRPMPRRLPSRRPRPSRGRSPPASASAPPPPPPAPSASAP